MRSLVSRCAVVALGLGLALGPTACRLSLEDNEPVDASTVDAPISATCMEATTHSDLAFIEDKIFKTSCIFSGCHNGNPADDAGRMDLRAGRSHAVLVNVDSDLEPTFKRVTPNQPNQSYILMMLKHIAPENMMPPLQPPPANVGFMPQNAGGASLCVQKRDAIVRWIMGGGLP